MKSPPCRADRLVESSYSLETRRRRRLSCVDALRLRKNPRSSREHVEFARRGSFFEDARHRFGKANSDKRKNDAASLQNPVSRCHPRVSSEALAGRGTATAFMSFALATSPRAVGMPRSFNAAAIPRNDVFPARLISSIVGARSAACSLMPHKGHNHVASLSAPL